MNTKPTKEELHDMLDEGMTLYQISRKYNTTIPVVFQLEKEYDIIPETFVLKKCYHISKEDLESMYIGEHMAQWQIAEEIGCSQGYVYNMMKYYNIKTRGSVIFTPQQRASISDEIEQRYKNGETQEQIAKEVGYSRRHVSEILHERGVQIRGRGKYTPHQRALIYDKIEQEYKDGKSTYQIAKEFGYSRSRIEIILQERGVQTRVTGGTITHQEMALITADKIQDCIDKGMNQHQIAEHFNVSDWKIFDLAEKFNIPGMVNNLRFADPDYIDWRDEVIIRDNYTCQMCGSQERPEVHHIYKHADYPERRFDVDNGIVLCHWCHQKVTGHESEYIVELEDIVLRDRHIGDDIKPGIDFIDYLARKFDQKGVDIFGGELPTHEYTSITKEE